MAVPARRGTAGCDIDRELRPQRVELDYFSERE